MATRLTGPVTQEPPYTDGEVERVAQALARGAAWGGFTGQPEVLKHTFAIPWTSKLRPRERLSIIEDGMIYAFEHAAPGKKILPDDTPRFSTMGWLDAATTRRVLRRVRELEWLGGRRDVPQVSEIEDHIATHERARLEALPKLRHMVLALGEDA